MSGNKNLLSKIHIVYHLGIPFDIWILGFLILLAPHLADFFPSPNLHIFVSNLVQPKRFTRSWRINILLKTIPDLPVRIWKLFQHFDFFLHLDSVLSCHLVGPVLLFLHLFPNVMKSVNNEIIFLQWIQNYSDWTMFDEGVGWI